MRLKEFFAAEAQQTLEPVTIRIPPMWKDWLGRHGHVSDGIRRCIKATIRRDIESKQGVGRVRRKARRRLIVSTFREFLRKWEEL